MRVRKNSSIIGKTVVRLTVIEESDDMKVCKCECTCGKIVTTKREYLLKGKPKSCGCYKHDVTVERNTKHGHSIRENKSPAYIAWCGMMSRCYTINRNDSQHYRKRGICVISRWHKFENFLADMGLPPKGFTLERRNVNKNYSPKNCKWATWKTQQRNRRNNRIITVKGITGCVAEVCEKLNFPKATVYERLCRGWSENDDLVIPKNYYRGNRRRPKS
jgi:hypothetical protein